MVYVKSPNPCPVDNHIMWHRNHNSHTEVSQLPAKFCSNSLTHFPVRREKRTKTFFEFYQVLFQPIISTINPVQPGIVLPGGEHDGVLLHLDAEEPGDQAPLHPRLKDGDNQTSFSQLPASSSWCHRAFASHCCLKVFDNLITKFSLQRFNLGDNVVRNWCKQEREWETWSDSSLICGIFW